MDEVEVTEIVEQDYNGMIQVLNREFALTNQEIADIVGLDCFCIDDFSNHYLNIITRDHGVSLSKLAILNTFRTISDDDRLILKIQGLLHQIDLCIISKFSRITVEDLNSFLRKKKLLSAEEKYHLSIIVMMLDNICFNC